MNEILASIIGVICAYFIGSIPFAYIVTKWRKGIDIREVGSHNLGAMNVFYTVGFWWGLIVLLLDISKGLVPVTLARLIGAPRLGEFAAGMAAVLGHSYPIFLNFKGGKGGATSIGVEAFLMPWGFAVGLAVFGLFLLITHFPTLSYTIGLATFLFSAWFIYHSWEFLAFTCVLLLIPVIRYIPRVKEMYAKSGGKISRLLYRKNLKDRL
jgi:glycerol-3-phosphate acyltransferase PlsY